MRNYLTLNEGWQFSKEAPKNFVEVSETAYSVDLPHTWNKYDGTDGGSDYQRGTFYYTIDVPTFEMKQGSRVYIEFKGQTPRQTFMSTERRPDVMKAATPLSASTSQICSTSSSVLTTSSPLQ